MCLSGHRAVLTGPLCCLPRLSDQSRHAHLLTIAAQKAVLKPAASNIEQFSACCLLQKKNPWQRFKELLEPSVAGPTIVNDGSIFLALGIW